MLCCVVLCVVLCVVPCWDSLDNVVVDKEFNTDQDCWVGLR